MVHPPAVEQILLDGKNLTLEQFIAGRYIKWVNFRQFRPFSVFWPGLS